MKRMLFAMCATAAVAASGCTTAYVPRTGFWSGGYSEAQLDRNTYKVEFKANSLTPRDKVQTYLLYRCAETTLLNKFDYFVIENNRVEQTGFRFFGGVGAATTIKGYYGAKPQTFPVSYNAREAIDLMAFLVKH